MHSIHAEVTLGPDPRHALIAARAFFGDAPFAGLTIARAVPLFEGGEGEPDPVRFGL